MLIIPFCPPPRPPLPTETFSPFSASLPDALRLLTSPGFNANVDTVRTPHPCAFVSSSSFFPFDAPPPGPYPPLRSNQKPLPLTII